MTESRSRRRSMSDINVVPYIDVMLVLLVIFMVTAPLLNQGVEVDLPIAPANPLDADGPEPLVISIDLDGNIFLNINANPDVSIDASSMVNQVQQALKLESKRPVILRGDASGPYENVVRVLVLLQQAHVDSVGLVTDPQDLPQ